MKKLITFFVLVMFLSNTFIIAQNVIRNGVKYKVIDNEHVTVVGLSDDNLTRGYLDIDLYQDLTIGEKSYPVTHISPGAFMDCKRLRRINLVNIESVGESAFEGSGLIAVALSSKAKEIGEKAFSRCSKLHSVYLSSSIEKLGFEAFQDSEIKMLTLESSFENAKIVGKYKEEEIDSFSDVLTKVFCRETLNGMIFAMPNDKIDAVTSLPVISVGMLSIVTINVGDNDDLNYGSPLCYSPYFEVDPIEKDITITSNYVVNAFWPEYTILVKTGEKINIVYPALNLCWSAPRKAQRADNISGIMIFNGEGLPYNDNELAQCHINTPFYDYTLNFNNLISGPVFTTPYVTVPSELTVGLNKANGIESINSDISVKNLQLV